jgi:hypothetical protein
LKERIAIKDRWRSENGLPVSGDVHTSIVDKLDGSGTKERGSNYSEEIVSVQSVVKAGEPTPRGDKLGVQEVVPCPNQIPIQGAD